MRLFIASPAVITDYTHIRRRFDDAVRGKWVEEHNVHLTWLFLGECRNVDSIIRRFMRITPVLTTPVSFCGLGTFGAPPRILYAKSADARLFAQAEALETAGFSLPRFTPHVTLCRIKAITDPSAFKAAQHAFEKTPLGEIRPRLVLYQSLLTPHGPRYTPLATLPAP